MVILETNFACDVRGLCLYVGIVGVAAGLVPIDVRL